MKKDHKKISDIVKKRNDIAELLIIEQNQYMPFLKELQKQAIELNTITEKIHFWENEKQKYLNGIDSYTFASSGIVSLNMPPNTELFLDKEITKEINKLKALIPPQQNETKTEQGTPKTFEELFFKPEHAEPCLKILSELDPPVIDATNNYIGKAKGVFPLWVKVLKNHKPEPLIKHFKDSVYKDLLNNKVRGLNLTKDASEFRKNYVRLENNKTELDIKTLLSQYSQSGKLGK
jgi:hypothetical protein